MESTVLLVHSAETGGAARRLSAALTGQSTGVTGFAPPLHAGTAFVWRVQNRYYRARLSLLVVPDTPEANPRLRELAMQAGALLLLYDPRAADGGFAGVAARWEDALSDAAPDVFLLLADGGVADEEAAEFALRQGAELVEIDCAEGSVDMQELAPLAAAVRGEAPVVETAGEWEGLARVLEAVQCRRWPEDKSDPSPLPGAQLTARLQEEAAADTRAAAAAERARRAGSAPSGRPAERDATADEYMAALVGDEPSGVGEAEDEALERLIAQMSAIRNNGAGLPDELRRERAAKLATEMSRLFRDGAASDDGSDADEE